jgi:hypothetical protein
MKWIASKENTHLQLLFRKTNESDTKSKQTFGTCQAIHIQDAKYALRDETKTRIEEVGYCHDRQMN